MNKNNLLRNHKKLIYKYYTFDNNYTFFNINYLIIFFSFKFKAAKVEYRFGLYDNNSNLIIPSENRLYKNISIMCHIKVENKNINIESLAGIYKDKYYRCIDFFNINEKINFGIKLYQTNKKENIQNNEYHSINFFKENIFNYKNLNYINDNIFSPLILNEKYKNMVKKMSYSQKNETLKLKKSYITYPYYSLKRFTSLYENIWSFRNIYNYYFCFCRGEICLPTPPQKCKFNVYLNIIDNSRNIYRKTEYLFVDFIFEDLSSDDAFPVFKEMEKRDLPVHYISENKALYKEYCYNISKCTKIIPLTREEYYNSGDFLEKYLTLFLKLKIVISGKYTNLHIISYLFYNIEYITYIAIGHGVCYFKDYLFSEFRLYGKKKMIKF